VRVWVSVNACVTACAHVRAVARVRLKVGVKLFFAFVLFHSVSLWVFTFFFCMYTWMTSNCTICLHNSVHICADVHLGSTKIAKYELYCHIIFVWSHYFWNTIRSIWVGLYFYSPTLLLGCPSKSWGNSCWSCPNSSKPYLARVAPTPANPICFVKFDIFFPHSLRCEYSWNAHRWRRTAEMRTGGGALRGRSQTKTWY